MFFLLLFNWTLSPFHNGYIIGFAAAWETAIRTTTYPATLSVSAGAFIPPESNATKFSVINSVIIDEDSIIKGKAKIIELAESAASINPEDSDFPIKFREAFLELTITVEGLDSTPSPAGPLPLTASKIPLI